PRVGESSGLAALYALSWLAASAAPPAPTPHPHCVGSARRYRARERRGSVPPGHSRLAAGGPGALRAASRDRATGCVCTAGAGILTGIETKQRRMVLC